LIPLKVAGTGPIRVLSIDGGGVRGILPAALLERLEEDVGECASAFDVIAGTSTGGLLALALARRESQGGRCWSASDLREVYDRQIVEVFPKFRGKRSLAVGRAASGAGLDRLLATILADHKLADARTEVCVPAYDIASRQPRLFTRFTAVRDGDPTMSDVARATSAAPFLFTPVQRKVFGDAILVDGGVFANNPALVTVAAIRAAHSRRRIRVLSLGTGAAAGPTVAGIERWRGFQWVTQGRGLDMFMTSNSAAADLALAAWLGPDYLRVQFDLGHEEVALNDNRRHTTERLKAVAGQTWSRRGEAIVAFVLGVP
jgi:patatin-like phospholipase/acyl hydrolase